MERCYRELSNAPAGPQHEAARWTWFRRYLDAITNSPLDVIWNALPDPGDFFADKPPVSDLSVRSLPESVQNEEQAARQNYYRLVRLGVWLAGLGVSVGDVARAVVSWVRFKERYGFWRWEGFRLLFSGMVMATKVFVHLCFSPQFVIEKSSRSGWGAPRPLFGWGTWLISVAISIGSAAAAIQGLIYALSLPRIKAGIENVTQWLSPVLSLFGGSAGAATKFLPGVLRGLFNVIRWIDQTVPYLFAVLGLASLAFAFVVIVLMISSISNATGYLLGRVGIARGLLHQYHLHRKLFEVFRDGPLDQREPIIPVPEQGGAMHVIIVAAALRSPRIRGQQVWAAPGSKLVNALLATLAAPGLFQPVRLEGQDLKEWEIENPPPRVDLIDGAAVRQNPLPALFSWLRKEKHHEVARELSSAGVDDARVHVVYNVPIEPYDDPKNPAKESVDIITAAFNSLELAKRRDTKLEVRQTNFLSEIEARIQSLESAPLMQAAAAGHHRGRAGNTAPADSGVASTHSSYTAFPIFADEIAPQTDITFTNNLAPEREQLLQVAAQGCRLTLGRLYRTRIKTKDFVPCGDLFKEIVHDGHDINPKCPGLSEICGVCNKEVRPAKAPGDNVPAEVENGHEFRHLNGTRSRIVFVASGGVFRGAFHIGVIAAMQAAEIRPDLIVGASVGSLMGGALAAISTLRPAEAHKLLADLCLTFLHVDKEIALTRTLKNAAKQLGTRTRTVKLSPAKLRRMIRRGGEADTAYAVTGAPPALIDAISTIFLFPHKITCRIAAEFVAGHISAAMKLFWIAVRSETLRRLDIENSLMGTSLIENVARRLLGEEAGIPMFRTQPYHQQDRSISFFSTTSDLNRKEGLVLPRDRRNVTSYDFVKAALSSSAFPVVFAPRQESEVLPGRGRTDVLFSDGGMFDNLPFFPAIEVLSSIQLQSRSRLHKTCREGLQERQSHPDLFIAGALESEDIPPGEADNAVEIYRRAGTLNVNVKLNSFHDTSGLVDAQINKLLDVSANKEITPLTEKFMDSIVPASVMKITPADSKHLNGTFAFCRAAGLKKETVGLSIADGCFQTLKTLAIAQHKSPDGSLDDRALSSLMDAQRMARIRHRKFDVDDSRCPFFKKLSASGEGSKQKMDGFECPFITAANAASEDAAKELREVYTTCTQDRLHRLENEKAMKKSE